MSGAESGSRVPPVALAITGILLLSALLAVAGARPAESARTRNSVDFNPLTVSASAVWPASPYSFTHRWTNVTSTANPGQRTQDSMAYDPLLKEVVLFGGNSPVGNVPLGDTWTFSGGIWSKVGPLPAAPLPRWGNSLAYDPQYHGVVLFGGRNATQAFNDTWVYRSTGWNLIALRGGPSNRTDAAMAYDVADKGMVLYGGGIGNVPAGSGSAWRAYSDSWMLTHAGWTNVSSSVTGAPGPLLACKITYFPGQGLLMIGGSNATGGKITYFANQTWSYRANVWTHLSPALVPPAANMQGSLAYDPLLHRAVLFGGATFVTNVEDNYTWVYDGHLWKNWTLKLSVAPPPRSPSGFAYDGADGYLVLFGGTRGSGSIVENDTWTFQ